VRLKYSLRPTQLPLTSRHSVPVYIALDWLAVNSKIAMCYAPSYRSKCKSSDGKKDPTVPSGNERRDSQISYIYYCATKSPLSVESILSDRRLRREVRLLIFHTLRIYISSHTYEKSLQISFRVVTIRRRQRGRLTDSTGSRSGHPIVHSLRTASLSIGWIGSERISKVLPCVRHAPCAPSLVAVSPCPF
jgi:hypothetical protein